MEKLIICTVCPQGCRITVTGEGEKIESVTGFTCPRGETYARQEFVCPMRILTGSVRTENAVEFKNYLMDIIRYLMLSH